MRALLRRWFGRLDAPRDNAIDKEIDALIVDLSVRLSAAARGDLQTDFDKARDAATPDRFQTIARLLCRAEDYLAETSPNEVTFRRRFREAASRQWPNVAAHSELSLVLLPPECQEEAFCLFFLHAAMDGARSLLGAAAGDRLGVLRTWLEAGTIQTAMPPFAKSGLATEAPASAIAALQICSHGFYEWLSQVLGRRADKIYEDSYRKTAKRYAAIDTFPTVLNLIPEHLLTPEKLSLLRRSQIERMLREKITQLEHANTEVSRAHDTLEERIRTRTSDLEEAKQEAVAANRAKSGFLAAVSHELRTPLNAILGFSQILMDPKLQRATPSAEYARYIYDSGSHLLNVINQILDTAKVDAGKYELNEEPVQIREIVAGCLTTMSGQLQEASLSVKQIVDDRLPLILADRRMLVQMLLNLLSNAAKFTPRGGSIRIEASRNQTGGFDLAVHDTGIGISETDIPLVLEPFGQARNVYVRDGSGTGLGLPLVTSMAHLHGGEFILQSKLGSGTSAIIRLPASRFQSPNRAPQIAPASTETRDHVPAARASLRR